MKKTQSDSWFRALHSYARRENKNRKKLSSKVGAAKIEVTFYSLAIVPYALAIIFGMAGKATGYDYFSDLGLVSLLLFYLGVLVIPLLAAWVWRRSILLSLFNPVGVLINNVNKTIDSDSFYLKYFSSKASSAI